MKQHNFSQTISKGYIMLMVLIMIIFVSCNDSILDEKPLDFLTPSNAYSNSDGAGQGIAALHAEYRDNLFTGLPWPVLLYAPGTDVAFFGENPGGGWGFANYERDLTPTETRTNYFWTHGFKLIQHSNVIIEGITASDISGWKDQAEKDVFVAEAKFYRAYIYRMLVYLYGDIPVITEVVNYAKTDFVRSPKIEVFKLIEDDLIFAGTHLPEPGKEAMPGRITQGAAWHLLSEIYIAQQKFQLAVDAASKVINGYQYTLMTERFGTKLGNDVFGSGDVYFDLFGKDNQNLKENTETIWAIQFEPNITGGGSYHGPRAFGPSYWLMGNAPDGKKAILGEFVNGKYTGYSDLLSRPTGWCKPTNYLAYDIWRSDWANDIRNAPHNIKRDFYFDNPASQFHNQKIDFSLYKPGTRDNIRDTCQYIFPYFMKVATPKEFYFDLGRSGGGYVHKDIYIMRLAETYLLRAEAYLGLGNKSSAAQDVNVVRSRAKATPVSSANVNIDFILDERARELYTEEMRMLTLLRLGLLVDRVKRYNNNPVNPHCNIQEYNNLWPIPQSEVDLNINGDFQQNPGYN